MRHSSTQSETRDKEKKIQVSVHFLQRMVTIPEPEVQRTIPMLDPIFFQNFFPNHFIGIINILII